MATLVKLDNGFPVLNSVFDEFFKKSEEGAWGYLNKKVATNIKETESAFVLELQLPGFKKEEIKIGIENQYLKVSAETSTETESNDKYHVREFKKSNFEKQYKIPQNVNLDAIAAKFENGILELHLNKKLKEDVKTIKTIDIL